MLQCHASNNYKNGAEFVKEPIRSSSNYSTSTHTFVTVGFRANICPRSMLSPSLFAWSSTDGASFESSLNDWVDSLQWIDTNSIDLVGPDLSLIEFD
jgi:hypothetical protein